METIHIFDEFPYESSEKIIHAKRTRLEPLVFDILKRKYFRFLEEFWQKNSVVTNSDKSIVIIERRIHENLAFILRNVFYFAPSWNITVICSDINYDYLKTICTNNKDNVLLLPLFSGSPDRDTARNEYNNLLKSVKFYETLPFEHLFIVQTDSYLRKHIDETMLDYDYVAAPFIWDNSSAGGGMSYRKKSSMIDICKNYKGLEEGEDCFINAGIKVLGYKMPEFMKGIEYIGESCFYVSPMGVHQWWTYFTNSFDHKDLIFHNYLRLEI